LISTASAAGDGDEVKTGTQTTAHPRVSIPMKIFVRGLSLASQVVNVVLNGVKMSADFSASPKSF
jgi:hypothetical protein